MLEQIEKAAKAAGLEIVDRFGGLFINLDGRIHLLFEACEEGVKSSTLDEEGTTMGAAASSVTYWPAEKTADQIIEEVMTWPLGTRVTD